MKIKVSCIQTNSFISPIENIHHVSDLIKKAIKQKPDLICLPECVGIFTDDKKKLNNFCKNDNIFLNFIKELSKKYKVHFIIGSLPFIKLNKKFLNRSFVVNNKGEVIAEYDKINLFDVKLNSKEKYLESKLYDPGKKIKVVSLPWGKLGLSICYDIRFPDLYKKLAKNGADFLSIPAAFTKTTGKAHWHSLIRSRAIENGCFVFAPAQCGVHQNNRETFGHSMIVDPWGQILAEAKNKPTVITAEINISSIKDIRRKIPSMTNYDF